MPGICARGTLTRAGAGGAPLNSVEAGEAERGDPVDLVAAFFFVESNLASHPVTLRRQGRP